EGFDAIVLRSGKSIRRTQRSTRRRPRPSLRAISLTVLPASKSVRILPNSLASAAHQALLRYSVRSTFRSCWKRRRRLIISGVDLRIRDRRLKATKLSLNGLAEVLQQMKPIGDLPRLRRALTRGLRIEASAVAADHLHFRMLLEPVGRGRRRTIPQQVHYLTALEVHDDRAVVGVRLPLPGGD